MVPMVTIHFGGFNMLTYPSETYEDSSIGMMTFRINGKIKNVPNHQPAMVAVG